ncbi:MAG: hypothetical protein ACXADC_11445 [Candidatus Thorarchaeota archaeon]|jgi:hypothetical protein
MQVVDPQPPGLPAGSFVISLMFIGTIIALAVYLIHRHDQTIPGEQQAIGEVRVKPWMITTTMFILAFFGPMSLNIYPGFGPFETDMIYIFAMTYQFLNIFTLDLVVFDLPLIMATALFSFMRPVFVYQLSRYYKGRTSRGRTIAVGIISELQMTIITGLVLLYLISSPIMAFVYMIAIPIPILLLLGLVFMWTVPVPEIHVPWKELDQPKSWWDEESKAVSDVIAEGN